MILTKLYIGIFVAFAISAIVVAGILVYVFKNEKSIDLIQEKLVNSDDFIGKAIPFLKLSNEWRSIDDSK